jgi:hypothetical protein
MALQRCDCPGRAFRQRVHRRKFRFPQIASIDRVEQVVLALRQGSARDVEEAGKICVRSPAESFGDVSWRRGRSVAELIVESDVALHRRALREAVDCHLELT